MNDGKNGSNSAVKKILQYISVYTFILAAIYGASYQQYLHFDLGDPRGASDSLGYVMMSHGEYFDNHKQFKFFVPSLAGYVRSIIEGIPHVCDYNSVHSDRC